MRLPPRRQPAALFAARQGRAARQMGVRREALLYSADIYTEMAPSSWSLALTEIYKTSPGEVAAAPRPFASPLPRRPRVRQRSPNAVWEPKVYLYGNDPKLSCKNGGPPSWLYIPPPIAATIKHFLAAGREPAHLGPLPRQGDEITRRGARSLLTPRAPPSVLPTRQTSPAGPRHAGHPP